MILDIILILLFIIIAIIGYKVGFLPTILKIASAISGLIIAVCFTEPVANLVVEWNWDSAIKTQVFTNITTSDVFVKYTEGGEGVIGITALLEELGIPSFLSGFIASGIVDSVNPTEIAQHIANSISYMFVFVITFLVLLIFSSLVFLILKLIVKGVRKNVGFFRFIDGIFGILFYSLIFVLVLYVIFLIVSLVLQGVDQNSGFYNFMMEQLHLDDEEFGIAKFLYQNNVIGNFFGLLF